MALFNPVSATPDVVAANKVKQSSNTLYQILLREYTENYNTVWHNRQASPIAVVAAMGTEAVKLFTLSAELAAVLAAAGANVPTSIPDDYQYVADQDGSIVVSRKAV